MTINLDENLLTMRQAAARLGVHISTLWRWRLRGVGGVKLDVVKVGGKTFTSAEELERFAQGTTAAREQQQPATRSSKQRNQQIAAAEAELSRLGIVSSQRGAASDAGGSDRD